MFKKTAEAMFGRFSGNGFVPALSLAQSEVFVMPGSYENAATVSPTIRTLSKWWQTL